jgi:streptogramin lyase
MYRKLLTYFFVAWFFLGMLLYANLPLAQASLQAKGEWVFPPYTKEGGLPSNYVYSIKINSAGDIWCCSAEGSDQKPKGGISKYIGTLDKRTNEWQNFDKSSGLPDDRVYAFDFDSVGNIWAATQKGVCKIHPSGTVLYTPKELEELPTKCIVVSKTGEIWVAKTASAGDNPALYRFDGSNWTRYDSKSAPYPNGLLDYSINVLTAGPYGDIWIGTNSGGATRFDPASGSWTHYTPSNSGLPHSMVNAIVFEGLNTVWFGMSRTSGNAEEAAKLNLANNSWTKYVVDHTDVESIVISGSDGIWFGTRTEGAYLYDETKSSNLQWIVFSTTSTEEGLPNDHVKGIVYDNYGYVWLATLSGGVGRLLAKSIPNYSEPGPGGAVDLPPGGQTTATSADASSGGSSTTASQEAANEELRRLARTGLNFLPYLIPGLFLLLIGLGSGSSKAR